MLKLVGQRRSRWVIAATAAAAAAVALTAGCSSNGSATSSGGGGGSKIVVVGGVFPRTGPFASNAIGVYEAADAFFKNINARGGVNGYKFKFIGIDDHGDTATAVAAYQKLIKQDNADILMNENETTFLGAAPTVKGSGVPVIGCFSTPACYHNAGMYPLIAYVQSAIARTAALYFKAHGVTKADLVTINIPGAVQGVKTDEQYLKAAGVSLPLETTFDPTTVDFTAMVARAKASGADHILFAANSATQLVPFVKAELQQGYKGQVIVSGFSKDFPAQLGRAADGLVIDNPSAPLWGAGKAGQDAAAVVKKYYPRIDLLNSYYAVNAWTTGEAIVQAVKDLGSQAVSRESLEKALNGFKNWQGTFNAPITYTNGPNTDPTHCSQVLINHGLTWQPLDGKRFTCWPASESTAPPNE